MKLEEFVALCNNRDWPKLLALMTSDIKDMCFKIIITAVIETYHPDQAIVKEKGLEVWNKRLSGEKVTPIGSLFTSAVDLTDFASACYLCADEKVLNDKKLANAIVQYVQQHKLQLAQYINPAKISAEEIDLFTELFGDITLSKSQSEAYFARLFSDKRKEKIEFMQAIDSVRKKIGKILGLEQHEFHLTYSEPSFMKGIKTRDCEGNIHFSTTISDEFIRSMVARLKEAGVGANFYNIPGRGARGVQLWSDPRIVDERLSRFLEDLELEQSKIIIDV